PAGAGLGRRLGLLLLLGLAGGTLNRLATAPGTGGARKGAHGHGDSRLEIGQADLGGRPAAQGLPARAPPDPQRAPPRDLCDGSESRGDAEAEDGAPPAGAAITLNRSPRTRPQPAYFGRPSGSFAGMVARVVTLPSCPSFRTRGRHPLS